MTGERWRQYVVMASRTGNTSSQVRHVSVNPWSFDWWPLFVPIFLAGVIAVAVVFGELRLRTGSISPGVVMCTAGGAVVNTLIVERFLCFSEHGDAFVSPAPNSIASIVLLGVVGSLILRWAEATGLVGRNEAHGRVGLLGA